MRHIVSRCDGEDVGETWREPRGDPRRLLIARSLGLPPSHVSSGSTKSSGSTLLPANGWAYGLGTCASRFKRGMNLWFATGLDVSGPVVRA